MKIRELIILPLLSIAIGLCCHILQLGESGQPLWLSALQALLMLGLPGVYTDICFRKYPERVRLSPASFGMIAAIPAAFFLNLRMTFIAGNAIIAITCALLPTFRPGKRLGEFVKIPVKRIIIPAAVSLAAPHIIYITSEILCQNF